MARFNRRTPSGRFGYQRRVHTKCRWVRVRKKQGQASWQCRTEHGRIATARCCGKKKKG